MTALVQLTSPKYSASSLSASAELLHVEGRAYTTTDHEWMDTVAAPDNSFNFMIPALRNTRQVLLMF